MQDDAPGELLGGRFRLGELLGVGGSASVYEADDVSAPGADPVAVKVLHPHLCDDDRAREAFLREAHEARRLDHPNIAAVRGSGLHEAGGVTMAWIALERVTGGSVAELVGRRGPLDPADAAAIVDGVLAGLGAAHAIGMVHRDVSPANVMLQGRDGDDGLPPLAERVRLVDFGLADATGRDALGRDLLRSDPGEGGFVVGNPNYMSPEQAQGLPVRAAGDLYQAGALLSFLLTGRPPFPRANPQQVLQAHLSAPPPVPSALRPEAWPFDRIVTRAMTKTPVRRYRDAAEFRAALAEAVAALPSSDPEPAEGEAPADEADGATRILPLGEDGGLGYLGPAEAADDRAVDPAAPARRDAGAAVAVLTVVALAVLVMAGLWGASALGPPGAAATPAPAPTSSASAPAPTPTPSVTAGSAPVDPAPTPTPTESAPEQVEVPALGGTLAEAQSALARAGLVLGRVERADSAVAADRVLAQTPAAGAAVAPGATVDLTVASGSNVVPEVAGMTVRDALRHLAGHGFEQAESPAGADETRVVTATAPASGTTTGLTTAIRLVLQPAPTPTPTPTGDPAGEAAP
jgi:serine/threonine-protein kinase